MPDLSAPPPYQAAVSVTGDESSTSATPAVLSGDEKESSTTGLLEYSIGQNRISPLVTLTEIKWHLLLLGAFHALRQRVTSANDTSDAKGGAAWSIFVQRAVIRFETWWQGMERSLRDEKARRKSADHRGRGLTQDQLIPPLDVLMIWHTYCLNPFAYSTDLHLKPYISFTIRSFPLQLAATQVDPPTFAFNLTPSQAASFRTLSSLDPTAPYTTSPADTITIPCPLCFWSIQVPLLGGEGEGGNGWLDPTFRTMCGGCMRGTTRDERCASKFVKDLRWAQINGKLFPPFLLDTVSGFQNDPDLTSPIAKLSAALLRVFIPLYPIGSRPFLSGGMTGIKTVFAQNAAAILPLYPIGGRPFLTGGIQSVFASNMADGSVGRGLDVMMDKLWDRYIFPEPFGVDLVEAVLRQGTFVQSMSDVGWLHVDRFEKSSLPLQQSISRYHAFLDLHVSRPGSVFCPTLDIDLSWHTHLLKTARYRDDSTLLLGRVLDHADAVEPSTLKSAYISTVQAWFDRFEYAYSSCGCQSLFSTPKSPSSSNPTKLFSQLRLKSKGKSRSSGIATAASSEAKAAADWTSGGDDANKDGSHPSVHSLPGVGNEDDSSSHHPSPF